MSAIFDWFERGEALAVTWEPGGGLRVVVDNDGERASIVLSDRAANALASAIADEFELSHCACTEDDE